MQTKRPDLDQRKLPRKEKYHKDGKYFTNG